MCELADRELNVGMGDEKLLRRAFSEAKGVEPQARQIYWSLRAKQLQDEFRDSESDAHVRQLRSEIEVQEKRLRSRKETHRWIWALACVAGLLGTAIFPAFAFRAVGKAGPSFFAFLVLSIASLALAAIAFRASQYHTHTE